MNMMIRKGMTSCILSWFKMFLTLYVITYYAGNLQIIRITLIKTLGVSDRKSAN